MSRNLIHTLFVAALSFGSLTAFADAGEPAIDGYCPVAYVAADKALKGSPEFTVEHDGHTWQFVSEDAKAMYEKNPEAYEVGYDGWCATAVAFGQKVAADPSIFSVYEGETYLFSNTDAKATFDADPGSFVKKADKAWKKLSR